MQTQPAMEELRFSTDVPGSEPAHVLACPCCGRNCNHIAAARRAPGNDDYQAWEGRGDIQVIETTGECGSRWELCLGFHKGNVFIFTRVTTRCTGNACPAAR